MRRSSLFLAVLLLAGCGGHGGSGGSSAGSAAMAARAAKKGATLSLAFEWPAAVTRSVPATAAVLLVSVADSKLQPSTALVRRPASGSGATTTSLTGLAVGNARVSVEAYPSEAAATARTGAQAMGSATVRVTSPTAPATRIALASTVTRLRIEPVTTKEGYPAEVVATAVDAKGSVVLIASEAGTEPVSWSVDARGTASVAGGGASATLKGLAAGGTTLRATMRTDDGRGVARGEAAVTVLAVHPKVTVSPATVTLLSGDAQTFAATMEDIYDPATAWSASGGTVDGSGRFVAPDLAGNYTVTATNVYRPSIKGTAIVNVPRAVTVSSPLAIVEVGSSLRLTARVSGYLDKSVVWTTSAGSISADGVLTAPMTEGDVTVTATSVFDPKVSGTKLLRSVEKMSVGPASASAVLKYRYYGGTSSPRRGYFLTSKTPSTIKFTAGGALAASGVIWSASSGSISADGTYTVPSLAYGVFGLAPSVNVTITAKSILDPTRTATSTVTITKTVTL